MSEDPEEHAMTFWEHLEELRSRIIRMGLAFAVGGVIAWIFRENLLDWLTQPFVEAWKVGKLGGSASLHFPAPASLFIEYVKLALLGGFVMALPIILYQLWAFVAPGLYSREKKLAIPFVVSSCALFALGGYFGWRFAFPIAFEYLLSFSGSIGGGIDVKPTVMVSDYLEFVSKMLLAFGAVFELPVLVFFLSIAGIINHTHMIRFARYFIIIAFGIAAVVTPPDVASQFLLAVPLCALYGISIGIAWIFGKKPAALAESAPPDDTNAPPG
jgi:sec-independent protein translocase protein TatC